MLIERNNGYLYLIKSTKFENSYKIGKTIDIKNRFCNHLLDHRNNIKLLLYGENNNLCKYETYLINKWYKYSNNYNYDNLIKTIDYKERKFFGSLCSKEYLILDNINLFNLIQDFNNICNNLIIDTELTQDLENINFIKNNNPINIEELIKFNNTNITKPKNLIKFKNIEIRKSKITTYEYKFDPYYAYQPSRSGTIKSYC